ncbi:MAG: hypothetical protein ACI81V_000208 [Lentimonas sp.]|jgi:hypothetical protein
MVTQRVEWTGTLTAEDLASTLELAVESASPFSLEQLAWGSCSDPASNQALIYMSLSDRCRQLVPNFEQAAHAYPAFLIALNQPTDADCVRLVATAADLSAICMTRGERIPRRIVSVAHSASIESANSQPAHETETLLASLNQLKAKLTTQECAHLESNIRSVESTRVEAGQRVYATIRYLPIAGGKGETREQVILQEDAVYSCDLRDTAYIAKLKKDNRLAEALWLALKASAIAAALCLLTQLAAWVGGQWLNAREAKVLRTAADVERVEQKEALLNGLELFSIAALQPFEALEIMNGLRPDSLYFESMRAGADREKNEESFTLELKGVATSAAEADNFAAQLRKNPRFSEVKLSNIRAQTRRTDFNLFALIPTQVESPLELPLEEADLP